MAAPMAARDRRRTWLALALVAAVAGVYAQVADHAFLSYDDDEVLTGAAALEAGLSLEGVRWALTRAHAANWLPLTHLSYLADQSLHGLSARIMLLENVALHALGTVLLFLAFLRMTDAPWRSAAVAAVFAVHPLHVESVAWASQRKDVLSGVFFSWALLAHARFVVRPDTARRLVLWLACAGAMLAKPTTVTLPFVLLLLDVWPLGRATRPDGRLAAGRLPGLVWEKAPILALAAAASVATAAAQAGAGAVVEVAAFPPGARVANALVACVDYLRTAFVPAGLAPFYPAPVGGVAARAWVPAAALLLAVTVACAVGFRRRPWLLVGWLWFLGMLVPMLGLVQVGSQARADRYTYLPLIGLSIVPVWALAELAARGPRARVAAGALCGVALLGLALLAHRQAALWRDGVTLFRHTVAVTRDNPLARAQLADALVEAGRPAEAAPELRAAVRQAPGYAALANNLAWLLATEPEVPRETPDEASRLALRAVALTGGADPVPLFTLAVAQASEGEPERAARTAERAARLADRGGRRTLAVDLRARAAALLRGGPGALVDPEPAAARPEPEPTDPAG